MAMYPCLSLPSLSFPTLTGSIVTFNAQYALPLKSHTIALTATQSGSGTPSPQNMRNISGVSELGINATGKNLIRCNVSSGTYNGVTFTVNEDFSITTSGEYQGTTIPFIYSYLVTLRAGTYILTGCPSGGSYSDYVVRIENSQAQRIALDTGNGATFTLTEDKPVFCRIYIYSQNGVGKTFYPMVRMVNTNSDYEPFGTYTTITIGSTVYGGEYDARTGVLTVTHGIVDLGTLNWNRYITESTQKTYFRTSSEISDCKKSTSTNITQGLTCSNYVENAWTYVLDASGYDLSCCLGWTNRSYIVIYDNGKSEMTTAEFKTAMNGVQLMYPLATPTTIQLPPCPIDTLEGENNIWADTGDTTLQYAKFG